MPTLVVAESKPSSERGSGILLPDQSHFEIVANWSARIADAASDGSLAGNNHLAAILYHWIKLGDPEAIKIWVRRFTKSNKGFIRFLVSMQSSGSSTGKSGDGHMFFRSSLTRFLTEKELAVRLRKLERVKLDGFELDAFRNLELVLGRKREDEDYDDFGD